MTTRQTENASLQRMLSRCDCRYHVHYSCLLEWYKYKPECPVCHHEVQLTPREHTVCIPADEVVIRSLSESGTGDRFSRSRSPHIDLWSSEQQRDYEEILMQHYQIQNNRETTTSHCCCMWSTWLRLGALGVLSYALYILYTTSAYN